MKYQIELFLLIVLVNSIAAAPALKISNRKGHMSTVEVREAYLDAATNYLSPVSDEPFLARLDSLHTPFSFAVEVVEEVKVVEAVVAKVNYDDASVLDVVASNFLKKVSGTMARGNAINLQLVGGGLVKAGASFPVRIPEIEDKVFTVTVTEVTNDGVGLSLGEAQSFFPYIGEGASTSVIRNSN